MVARCYKVFRVNSGSVHIMFFDFTMNAVSSMAHPMALYFLLVGILLLCGFGLPLPEDVVLITGGYLAYSGYMDIRIFVVAAMAGVLLGDSSMFMIGKKTGSSIFNHRFLSKFIKPFHIRKARAVIEKYHDRIFFIARFLPGFRSAIFFTGGALKTKFMKFFLYDGLAALISVPALVLASYFGGEYIDQVFKVAKGVQTALLILTILVIIFLVIRIKRWMRIKSTHDVPSEDR
jgi:membrane protein DedA with SNARE-associated domain